MTIERPILGEKLKKGQVGDLEIFLHKIEHVQAVSYTHLTLPTILLV